MNKQIKDCEDLSICYCNPKNKPQELMANGVFITKEIYKTLCSSECKNKSNCLLVLDKLEKLNTNEASDLLTK